MRVGGAVNRGGHQERSSLSPGARAALLVLAAIVIGAVLYSRLPSPVARQSTQARSTATSASPRAATSPAQAGSATSKPTSPSVAPGSVRVLVANGTTVNGAAGRASSKLAAAGFDVLQPVTATIRQAHSFVFYAPGDQPAAAVIASDLGLPASVVKAMPASPPVTDTLQAMVLVVLGPQLAASYGPPAGAQG